MEKRLELDSLSIRGFRGIRDLVVSRLGQVTLIAGKNGVGKTSILDAVRAYASRGELKSIKGILRRHDELIGETDEDGRRQAIVDWHSLFHGRTITVGTRIEIGPRDISKVLGIEPARASDLITAEAPLLMNEIGHGIDRYMAGIKVDYGLEKAVRMNLDYVGDRDPFLERQFKRERDLDGFPPEIKCTFLGPNLLTNATIVRYWEELALTKGEDRAIDALKLIYGDSVERVALIGVGLSRPFNSPRIITKLKGERDRVPLRSLGEGAVRIFGVALALAYSRGGILVIDEVENGIHHSVQAEFWAMVLNSAIENQVQVIATTHGWNCVAGFASALERSNGQSGVLVRIEKDQDKIRAIEYSEKDLQTAATQGIEVR